MEYVGILRRGVAAFVDGIVFFVIGYIIALLTGGTSDAGFNLQGAPAFLAFLVWLLYYVGLEATSGATLGKMVLGVRVVKPDGSPIGWGPSLIRNVLRIIDALPFFYIVGMILISMSPLKQRLGDRVAGTVVVRRTAARA